MSPSKKKTQLKQQRLSVKKRTTFSEVRDQNLIEGEVKDGGIAIQNPDAVHITQNITNLYGDQPPSIGRQDVLELEFEIKDRKHYEPDTILIPEGLFWMGSKAGEGIPDYETPQKEILLPAYRIGKQPVKNSEYEEFVRQKRKLVPPIMGWEGQSVPDGQGNSPVLGVTWNDAVEYCEWISEETRRIYSLPNEAQWEKACRGSHDGANFTGNVLEWTCSLWGEKRIVPDLKYWYPWQDDSRNDLQANRQLRRVVRGLAATEEIGLRRCTTRRGRTPEDPGSGNARHSFRVILTT